MPNIVKTLGAVHRFDSLIFRTFVAGLFVSLCSQSPADDYLKSEMQTISALKNVLQAQQQVLKTKHSALQSLAAEGHASKLECVASDQSLIVNQNQLEVCNRQIKLLQRLQTNADDRHSSELLIFDPAAMTHIPARIPFVMEFDSADEQLQQQVLEAQSIHDQVIEKRADSVRHQIALLRETSLRLRKSEDKNSQASSERNLNNQQIAIREAELRLLESRPSSLRRVRLPELLRYKGHQISDEDVVALVSTHWNWNLLKARRKTDLMLAKSVPQTSAIETHHTSGWLPESVDAAVAGRRIDQMKQHAQIMKKMADDLQITLDSLTDSDSHRALTDNVERCSELMALFTDVPSSAQELNQLARRISVLSSQDLNDKQILNELNWTSLRHQHASAKSRRGQLMAQAVLSPLYQATGVPFSKQRSGDQSFLTCFCDGQLEQAELDQKVAARSLATARLQAIRQLHSEGHASWLELKRSESEVLQLENEVAAANLELAGSRLRQQILDRIWSQKKQENEVASVSLP